MPWTEVIPMNDKIRYQKSIMYKIISLGCTVYVDEQGEFLINVLVCQNCRQLWNKSRTECLYCGTENYHVFTCTECKKHYSITNAKQKCNTKGCEGKLIKACINPNCISNTNKRLEDYLIKYGGVFNIKTAGSTLNEMHCKKCGATVSTYIATKMEIVEEFDQRCTTLNKIYVKRKGNNCFDARYNGQEVSDKDIETILKLFLDLSEVSLLK